MSKTQNGLRLRTKLTLTHALVATSIVLVTVLGVRSLGLQLVSAMRARDEIASNAETLGTTISSVSEESYSYMLTGDVIEVEHARAKFADAERRILALDRSPLAPRERAALDAVRVSLARMQTSAEAMCASYAPGRPLVLALHDDYELAIDDMFQRLASLNVAVRAIELEKAETARANEDRLLALLGIVAALVALFVGRLIGGRLTTPILALRDAALAFGAGKFDAFDHQAKSNDEIGQLADTFAVMASDRSRHLATIERARRDLADVFASINETLIVTDEHGVITAANERESLVGCPVATVFANCRSLQRLVGDQETTMRSHDGAAIPVQLTVSALRGRAGWVLFARDLREKRRLENDLRLAQKLETVGRLTAGVAHEINTPLQFIGDSLAFLDGACLDVVGALENDGVVHSDDVKFAMDEMAPALRRASEGVERVASIVRSLKEFSHPNQEPTPMDMNKLVASTLVMAHHEYKYVAEVEQHFADLPLITCVPSEISQALLNLVVNAAHAITDAHSGRGKITVRTELDDSDVIISIEDTGPGIPLELREKIFEPFFTTKEIGRGTGQGLPIVRSVVTRHGGTVTFDTGPLGTKFHVRIPLVPKLPESIAPVHASAA